MERHAMSRSFKTPKGTELPLMNLRGKEYLEVKFRLVWFREERPEWSIETEFLQLTNAHAIARAVIRNEAGRIMSTATKVETKEGFGDFVEKAETGAIGRALLAVGFGTSFCGDELDEGERIVDSPVERQPVKQAQPTSDDPASFKITFGKKFPNMTIAEAVAKVGLPEVQNYAHWLKDSAQKQGKPLFTEAQHFFDNVGRFANRTRERLNPQWQSEEFDTAFDAAKAAK
jgi:hypothetical protein